MSIGRGLELTSPFEQLTLPQLRRRSSVKWTTHPDDVLPLWVAEMDVLLAEPVAARLHASIAAGDTGYPTGPADAYADAVASFAADRWGWMGVDPARCALVPDVMVGIVEVLRLITEPGDAVVVCAPVYPPFYAFVTHADRSVIEARLAPNGRLDLTTLEAACAAARRVSDHPVLLLCNPHNPTGAVHTRTELAAVAALAERYGVRVIADEVHAPLVLPGATFVPYLSIPGTGNAYAVYSASKAFNLASLKAALVVAGDDAADELAQLPEEVSHLPSHLGVLSHVAAFEEGRDWLDHLLSGLAANRSLLDDLVTSGLPGITMQWPEATYLGWLDCRSLDLHHDVDPSQPAATTDLAGPALMFLERARVALTSGHAFGSGGAGFVRLNYATNAAILNAALERMAGAVDALNSERAAGAPRHR